MNFLFFPLFREDQNIPGPFPALVAGGLLASIAALLIGAPVLRLRGHYLSVASLGFMVIVTTFAKTLGNYSRFHGN